MLRAVKRAIFPFAVRAAKFRYHTIRVWKAKIDRRFSNKKTIVSVVPGDAQHDGGVYALFLVWQPKKVAWYVQNALESLAEAGINVVVIVNHQLSDAQIAYFKKYASQIIIRDNTGFDIGGFKDATLHMKSLGLDINRVIYINDSIYFFKKGLTNLFKRLANSNADVCGAFENWEIHYHIQSFCFSVNGKTFDNPKFQQFWDEYLPVNSRLWAIRAGEVALSRTMIPIAESIEILYKPNDLRDALNAISDKSDYLDLINLYPGPIRVGYEMIEEAPKTAVVQELVSRIGLRSQIHTGGFLYRKYLDCPIMKRDLLYRLQFTADEIEHALIVTGHEGHIDEIMTDFRKKGSSDHLPLIKRLQVANGIL